MSAKNTTEASPFLAEIERVMAKKCIADLEELVELFMEQEPERIGNARWTFERALEAADREQERLFLAWAGWDPPIDA